MTNSKLNMPLITFLTILVATLTEILVRLNYIVLPKISDYFDISYNLAQISTSFSLVGLAMSVLIYGPLSDHYGRRPVILIGIGIFTVSNIAYCFVSGAYSLMIIRFFQGLGSGSAAVIGYSIIKDLYSGNECAKNISKLNMFLFSIAPVIALVIGNIISYLQNLGVVFVIISSLSILIFAVLYLCLSETSNNLKSNNITFKEIILQYVHLLCNIRFVGFSLIHGLTNMWSMAYASNLPFVITKGMHATIQHYTFISTLSSVAYFIGTIINQKCVTIFGIKRMLFVGVILCIIPDIVVLITYNLVGVETILNHINIAFGVVALLWFPNDVGIAIITSNNTTYALEETKETGSGAAFILFSQLIFSALGSYIVGYFYDGTVLPNVYLTIVCSITCLFIYKALMKSKKYSN